MCSTYCVACVEVVVPARTRGASTARFLSILAASLEPSAAVSRGRIHFLCCNDQRATESAHTVVPSILRRSDSHPSRAGELRLIRDLPLIPPIKAPSNKYMYHPWPSAALRHRRGELIQPDSACCHAESMQSTLVFPAHSVRLDMTSSA